MAMTYWTATCQAHKDDPETRPLPLVLTLKSHVRACCPFTKRKLRLREAQHPQLQVRCDHQPAWLFLLLDVGGGEGFQTLGDNRGGAVWEPD